MIVEGGSHENAFAVSDGIPVGCRHLAHQRVFNSTIPGGRYRFSSAGRSVTVSPKPCRRGPLEGREAGTLDDAPIKYWLTEQYQVFLLAPPEGVLGIAVPAIISEPQAIYKPPPANQWSSEELMMTEIPTPTLRVTKPTEQVGTESGLDVEKGGSAFHLSESMAPASTVTFDSLDFDDNIANTGGFLFIPPDPIGAVGPNHVVNVVNVSIQFHTKVGAGLLDSVAGPPVTGVSLASFFAPLAPVNFTFDPKVIYDQHADRFVVVTLERQFTASGDPADTSRILVAVSDDSDPNGTWFLTAINSKITIGVASWADYPGLAVDEEVVYITANMFSFPPATMTGTRLWVIDKFTGAGGGFYGGGTATVSLFDPYSLAGFAGTTQPAHIFGTAPTTPNVGTWFTLYDGLSFGGPGGLEALQVMRLDDPVGPGTPTFSGPFFVSLADIEDIGGIFGFPSLPDAPQMGTAETIETNDRRTLNAVWRNNRLYTTMTINPKAGDPSAGEATAHWVEIDTSTLGVPAVADEGSIGGEDIATGTYTFFPSIAVNDSDDVAIGFAASAGTIFPSAAYTTRAATDPPGSNTGSALLRAGLDFYIRTLDSPPCSASPARNRWGDYSGMALDPFDQCFWAYNQYAITRGTGTTGGCNGRPAVEDGRWGTAYGYFCESCPTNLVLSSLTVSGTESHEARDVLTASTVTVQATGDLTLTSDEVGLAPGFSVASGGELTIINGPCQ